MTRPNRTLLTTMAAVAAVNLTFVSVAAQDDQAPADEMASMAPMEPGIQVMDAWTRESPMRDLAGAAYMVIHNSTDSDDALIGVTSSAAEHVELHLSSMDDEGMMSMNQVTEIPVPAQADAVLEPGGYHVMLVDLVEPLLEGAEVELSLEFMNAEPQTISAPVMAAAPMTPDMDMGDGMDMGDDMDDSIDEAEG